MEGVRASRRPGLLALVGGIALSVGMAGMAGAWVERPGSARRDGRDRDPLLHYEPSAVTVPLGVPITFTIHNGDPIDHEWIVGDAAVHERHRTGSKGHGLRPTEIRIPAGTTDHDRGVRVARVDYASTSATSRATRPTGWSARSRSGPAEA